MDPNTDDKCPYERHAESRTEKRGTRGKENRNRSNVAVSCYVGGLQKLERQRSFLP